MAIRETDLYIPDQADVRRRPSSGALHVIWSQDQRSLRSQKTLQANQNGELLIVSSNTSDAILRGEYYPTCSFVGRFTAPRFEDLDSGI